jgi:GDP-4-dehydro-6-deoxy-D-mannose reductase
MKRILITGASGFAGGYLAKSLLSLSSDFVVYGTYLSDSGLKHSLVKDSIRFIKADLRREEAVKQVIEEVLPDTIFHLAASASPGGSLKDPVAAMHNNIDTQIHVLEAVRHMRVPARVMITSSALIYGKVEPSELPIDEQTNLNPVNPYAVSKIAQDYLGLQYYLGYGIQVLRVRPFNHIGPRQTEGYVVSDFAKQIAEIEKGKKEPVIRVGNLSVKRDLTDVRDMVLAYIGIMQKGEPGQAYNIGSGQSVRIEDVLHLLLSIASVKIEIVEDQEKIRKGDAPEIICDRRKISSLTGWKPEIPLLTTLTDTLDYWRSIV